MKCSSCELVKTRRFTLRKASLSQYLGCQAFSKVTGHTNYDDISGSTTFEDVSGYTTFHDITVSSNSMMSLALNLQ